MAVAIRKFKNCKKFFFHHGKRCLMSISQDTFNIAINCIYGNFIAYLLIHLDTNYEFVTFQKAFVICWPRTGLPSTISMTRYIHCQRRRLPIYSKCEICEDYIFQNLICYNIKIVFSQIVRLSGDRIRELPDVTRTLNYFQ